MDMNYFLKRLQAGEDMSDIGNEIAELMNEAQAAYDAEEKAKAEALVKAAAERRAQEEAAAKAKAQKKELARQICDLIGQYGAMECPGLEGVFAVSEEDIDAFVKSMTDVFGMFKNLYAINDNLLANAKNMQVKIEKTDDDILRDYIAKILG